MTCVYLRNLFWEPNQYCETTSGNYFSEETLQRLLEEMPNPSLIEVWENGKPVCDVYRLQYWGDDPFWLIVNEDICEYQYIAKFAVDEIMKLVRKRQQQQ